MSVLKFDLLEPRSLQKNCKIREAIELLNGEFGMIVTILNKNNSASHPLAPFVSEKQMVHWG